MNEQKNRGNEGEEEEWRKKKKKSLFTFEFSEKKSVETKAHSVASSPGFLPPRWLLCLLCLLLPLYPCVYVTEHSNNEPERRKKNAKKDNVLWLNNVEEGDEGEDESEQERKIYIPHPVFIVIWVRFLCFAWLGLFLSFSHPSHPFPFLSIHFGAT